MGEHQISIASALLGSADRPPVIRVAFWQLTEQSSAKELNEMKAATATFDRSVKTLASDHEIHIRDPKH